jgi:hypothetical protein
MPILPVLSWRTESCHAVPSHTRELAPVASFWVVIDPAVEQASPILTPSAKAVPPAKNTAEHKSQAARRDERTKGYFRLFSLI